MANKNRRVVRYKAPINLNAGIVIFGIIFLYVAINVVIYFATDRVSYYEVIEGSVADSSNNSYTAIAIRDESVFCADTSGYINFYARDNSRISKNTTLYSIDESGRINDLIDGMTEQDKELSNESINTIKDQLFSFVSNFDEMNYSEVDDFKFSLQATVVELINMNALENIYSTLGDSQIGQFQLNKSASTGIVEYYIDNYEYIKTTDLKASLFNKDNYTAAKISSGDLVEAGAPIYKTISDEEWQLAIQLTDEDVKKYADSTALKILFKKDRTTVSTNFEIITGQDNKKYGIFTFQKYLIKYSGERFIEIEIIEEPITGLKVPKKSIVHKDFFVIPIPYGVVSDDTSTEVKFIRREYDKAEVKDVLTTVNISYKDDTYFYISADIFKTGDEIIMPKYNNNNLQQAIQGESPTNTPEENTENNTEENLDDSLEQSTNSESTETNDDDSSESVDTQMPVDLQEEESTESTTVGTINYPDTYVVRDTQSLTGVYNINNGYTQFVFVDINAETGDYYIVEPQSKYGLMVYDHIILNSELVNENQVIFQ